jgi:hypothetical protein
MSIYIVYFNKLLKAMERMMKIMTTAAGAGWGQGYTLRNTPKL